MKALKKVLFSRQSILPWSLVLIIVVFVSGHWLMPISKKQTFRIYQFDSSGYQKDSYACKTITGLTAFPSMNQKGENDGFVTIDTQITTSGSKLSIEVQGEVAKVLTDTAVGIGVAEGDEFEVLKNNSDNLAIGFESKGPGNWFISLISINKKTGLGIWTKSALRDDLFRNPSGQIYYLECL